MPDRVESFSERMAFYKRLRKEARVKMDGAVQIYSPVVEYNLRELSMQTWGQYGKVEGAFLKHQDRPKGVNGQHYEWSIYSPDKNEDRTGIWVTTTWPYYRVGMYFLLDGNPYAFTVGKQNLYLSDYSEQMLREKLMEYSEKGPDISRVLTKLSAEQLAAAKARDQAEGSVGTLTFIPRAEISGPIKEDPHGIAKQLAEVKAEKTRIWRQRQIFWKNNS